MIKNNWKKKKKKTMEKKNLAFIWKNKYKE